MASQLQPQCRAIGQSRWSDHRFDSWELWRAIPLREASRGSPGSALQTMFAKKTDFQFNSCDIEIGTTQKQAQYADMSNSTCFENNACAMDHSTSTTTT